MWPGLWKSTMWAQKMLIFVFAPSYCNLITYLYYHDKIFTTTAELNGLSSAVYGNEILHWEQKILAKILLSAVCTHMVNVCRSGRILPIIIIQNSLLHFIVTKWLSHVVRMPDHLFFNILELLNILFCYSSNNVMMHTVFTRLNVALWIVVAPG